MNWGVIDQPIRIYTPFASCSGLVYGSASSSSCCVACERLDPALEPRVICTRHASQSSDTSSFPWPSPDSAHPLSPHSTSLPISSAEHTMMIGNLIQRDYPGGPGGAARSFVLIKRRGGHPVDRLRHVFRLWKRWALRWRWSWLRCATWTTILFVSTHQHVGSSSPLIITTLGFRGRGLRSELVQGCWRTTKPATAALNSLFIAVVHGLHSLLLSISGVLGTGPAPVTKIKSAIVPPYLVVPDTMDTCLCHDTMPLTCSGDGHHRPSGVQCPPCDGHCAV